MLARGARERRGFTLIELLTVAGIAIVLATLIVTAIFAAQEASRSANCRSNLAQDHKLLMIYTQTYGQFLPAFWHERWVGELRLAGGQWRQGLQDLKKQPKVKYIYTEWAAFLRDIATSAPGTWQMFPPATNNGHWNNILYRVTYFYAPWKEGGYVKVENADDINPLMPDVWNNYQSPISYLGWPFVSSGGAVSGEGRTPQRSGSPTITCPSDTSNYRCDQGPLVSYMGLAKYGWWHRNDCGTTSRYYEYHQLQEVENPTRGILLAETEPGTWQYGGCG